VVIAQVALVVATAATIVSQLIFVTTDNVGDLGESGVRRVGRFLAGISLPLVLIAAIWALTIAVGVYVERLLTDRSAPALEPSHGEEIENIIDPPETVSRAVGVDDAVWRRT